MPGNLNAQIAVAGHRGAHDPWAEAPTWAAGNGLLRRFRHLYADGHGELDALSPVTQSTFAHFGVGALPTDAAGLRSRVIALERLVIEMQERSAQRESELQDAHNQLRRQLEASTRLACVGEMASVVSHEVTQPLSIISSFATASLNLLAKGHEKGHTGKVLQSLEEAMRRIIAQANRGGEVVRRVQAFVRCREASHDVVTAQAILDAILPLIVNTAERSRVRVVVAQDPITPVVACDKVMVEQVLLNLCVNAIQAMDANPAGTRRTLNIAVQASADDTVEFAVKDSGSGISAEALKTLFTPFNSSKERGLGLGLSLCRSVVEAHGSRLHFENVECPEGGAPEGARFSFQLPTSKKAERALVQSASVARGVV